MSQTLKYVLISSLLFMFFHFTYPAQMQCHCDEYTLCLNVTHWHAKHQFARCQRRCEKKMVDSIRKVPKEYMKCLKEFDNVFTRVMKCTTKHLGFGCTNSKHNTVGNKDLSAYYDMINDRWSGYMKNKSIALIYKTTEAKDFNTCLFDCFHPSVNTCTERLGCGLLAPKDKLLLDVLTECGSKADVTEEIFVKVLKCLNIVMEDDPNAKDNEYEYEY